MTQYTTFKLTPRSAQKELAQQRRNLQRLSNEYATTSKPDAVRHYMNYARLAIICAKRGYMLCIND
jgi:hypothetical protein